MAEVNPYAQFEDASYQSPIDNEPNPYAQFETESNDEQPSYLTRVGNDLSQGLSAAEDLKSPNGTDDLGTYQSNLQNAGTAAGSLYSPITEGIKSLYGYVSPSIDETARNIASTPEAQALAPDAAPLAEAATNIGDKLSEIGQKYPNAIKDLGAVANIAGVIPGVGAVGEELGTGLNAAGKAVEASGDAAKASQDLSGYLDLTQTKQTPDVLSQSFKKQGINPESGTANFTAKDTDIANEVAKVLDVNLKNSLLENGTAINKEYGKEAESLRSNLPNTTFPVDEYQSQLNDLKNQIQSTEGIDDTTRNARIAAVDKMIQITNRKDGILSAPELLDARQALDKTFLTQNGDLTSAAEKNYQQGIKPIRDLTNNFIAEKAPNPDVLASLKKQSLLKSAVDNIATKIPDEIKQSQNAPGWLTRNLPSIASVGIGGDILEHLAAHFPEYSTYAEIAGAPLVAGAIGVKGAKTAYDALKNPAVRQVGGKTLSGIGRLIGGRSLADISPAEIATMSPEVQQQLLALSPK